MNSLFIYLFFEIIANNWFNGYIDAITFGLLGLLNATPMLMGVISSLFVFMLEWYLCRYLYKNKIFIKI